MATHVSTVPRRGFPSSWLAVLAAVVLVLAVVGTAFAIGRSSAPSPASVSIGTQTGLGPRLDHMAPWMQQHAGDIGWMQGHMGDVRWMQSHAVQWRWMQSHISDIGWMHDHWSQWSGWQSNSGYPNGSGGLTGHHDGWSCGQWC